MTPHTARRACALALLAASGAVLVACGSSNTSTSAQKTPTATSSPSSGPYGGSSSGGGGTNPSAKGASKLAVKSVEAGGLSFSPKTMNVKAGTVTFTIDNPSGDQLPHAVAIEGNGVSAASKIAQPGSTEQVTTKLKPGRYTFFCPVDSHRQQGMQGTLVVK